MINAAGSLEYKTGPRGRPYFLGLLGQAGTFFPFFPFFFPPSCLPSVRTPHRVLYFTYHQPRRQFLRKSSVAVPYLHAVITPRRSPAPTAASHVLFPGTAYGKGDWHCESRRVVPSREASLWSTEDPASSHPRRPRQLFCARLIQSYRVYVGPIMLA